MAWVAAISVAQSITGCIRVDTSDVPGVYVGEGAFAKETLALKADGTYLQTVENKLTKKTDSVGGTWHYDRSKANITFTGEFMLVTNGFGELQPNYARGRQGAYVTPLDRLVGRIAIGVSEGIIYYKQ